MGDGVGSFYRYDIPPGWNDCGIISLIRFRFSTSHFYAMLYFVPVECHYEWFDDQ